MIRHTLLFILITLLVSASHAQSVEEDDASLESLVATRDSLDQARIKLGAELTKTEGAIDSLEKAILLLEANRMTNEEILLEIFIEAKVKQTPKSLGKVIATIPVGSKVVGLDYNDTYWKIKHDGGIAFISDVFVGTSSESKGLKKRAEAKRGVLTASLSEKKKEIEFSQIWIKSIVANIREQPSTNASVIFRLEQGDICFVQERRDVWLRVMFNGPSEDKLTKYKTIEEVTTDYDQGWIHGSIVSDIKIKKLTRTKQRRREFVSRNANISSRYKTAILAGQILLGMSEDMARASRGEPDDINRSVGSWGVKEQWVYGDRYIYFKNGVLTSWQD